MPRGVFHPELPSSGLRLLHRIMIRKTGKILSGFALLLIGAILALPLVPGPGIPIMILGLVILADHFPWARRIIDWGKAKLEGVAKKHQQPTRVDKI
jgi:hypothetical protein